MPFNPQAEYDGGFRGVYYDADAAERLTQLILSHGQAPDAASACRQYGLSGSGEGQLSMPFRIIETVFPGSLPASAQDRGDCVSHSTRTAVLGSLACEIASGHPDEVTGEIEGPPNISEAGRLDGVLSTEAIYWWRGHGGDGWTCDHAAEVCMSQSGMWLRKDYPELGIDLTRYSGSLAGKWGRSNPPAEIKAIGQDHLVRTTTRARSFEEVRDLLHNGYCISSCGGESFSATRDANGVSSRTRGGWAHAMAYLGVDDREETRRMYGGPLVHVQNSWGPRWGSGGRQVHGTDVEIPLGGFWAKWADIKNRYAIAFSGLDGWPPQNFDRWFPEGLF
jgi:hypothetical protein